eukprot:1741817-Rhodomonas_salina.2
MPSRLCSPIFMPSVSSDTSVGYPTGSHWPVLWSCADETRRVSTGGESREVERRRGGRRRGARKEEKRRQGGVRRGGKRRRGSSRGGEAGRE